MTNAWFTKRQKVFRVRTSNRSLLASANHPFLRLKKVPREQERHASGRFAADEWATEWVRVDQLRRGDRIVTLRDLPDTGKPQVLSDGTLVTERVGWLLGLIAGDGWISPYGVAICVYGEIRERAARICKEVWGANNSRHESFGIIIHSARLRDALRDLGGLDKHAHQKRVPRIVQSSGNGVKRAFLDGYAAADGHEARTGRVYASTSQDLISEVRMMHVALGDRVSNLTLTENQRPFLIRGKLFSRRRPLWRFHVTRTKSRGLDDGQVPTALSRFLTGNFAYQQVLSVESAWERDTYDLEVEGCHNFVAEGMVVHNSHSMSGEPMAWASAVALTLAQVATRQASARTGARPVTAIFFNTQIVLEVAIDAGERDPRKFLSMATVAADGGTDYDRPLSRALEVLEGRSTPRGVAKAGASQDADILLVTDGRCELGEAFAPEFARRKAALGCALVCVLVGEHATTGSLEPHADRLVAAADLARASGGRDAAARVFDAL